MFKKIILVFILCGYLPVFADGSKKDEFLCNENCEALAEVNIYVYDESGSSLSSVGESLRDFLNKNMDIYRKYNSNINKNHGGQLVWLTYEKNSVRLPISMGLRTNRFAMSIFFEIKQNGAPGSMITFDQKLFTPNFVYINTVQCKKSDVNDCAKKMIDDFSFNVVGRYLFKNNLKSNL